MQYRCALLLINHHGYPEAIKNVYDIMMDVDEALQTCDTILDEIDLGIDYTSREKQS